MAFISVVFLMITIALKNSYEMLETINKMLRFDDNSILLNNSGLDIMDKAVEEDEIPGQVDDDNAAGRNCPSKSGTGRKSSAGRRTVKVGRNKSERQE